MKTTRLGASRVSERLSQLDDSELLRIARIQLPYVTTAYEVIFHRYHSKLIQVCYRYLGSIEEAEETVSDTLLNVFNNIHRFEGRSSFKTWIYQIAHNQSLNRLRKKKLTLVAMDEADFIAEEQVESVSIEYNEKIDLWLANLSVEERSIVVFRIVSGLKFNEISEIVDQNLSTVKMRYKRALEKIPNNTKK
ncbi:sigma-70 family RNA polymerase sigma factor [Paraglaciecola psychrophila]|uniref:RNA polymerase sigma factor SigX n=1 Tax=Paraglaciecola psychrophila 170 TaxID=1129794 RepID=K7AHC1_9ALTE|nr:sigma-70 family RNA polymerase sigma factor [Paraglaciecola psychrophila]AGH47539.1 RNA polymerase sigma factor SigX [Paraglaciecola psychrophila 170]GAC39998.1 RNA polymerase sigma-70 factor, ECF subfamily [Paraglaciecola psychrophila 170]